METLTVGELESRYSEVVDTAEKGGKIFLKFADSEKVVGEFIPIIEKKREKRKLGTLKGKVEWVGDGKITGKELEEMLS